MARRSGHRTLATHPTASRLLAPTGSRRGITAFVIPMDSPAISVRAIEKIGAADEEFCEVFFDDVRLPSAAMLGPLNGGWKVAMESLSFERDMIWIMNLVEIERALEL